MEKSTIYMTIFHCYVSSPEGVSLDGWRLPEIHRDGRPSARHLELPCWAWVDVLWGKASQLAERWGLNQCLGFIHILYIFIHDMYRDVGFIVRSICLCKYHAMAWPTECNPVRHCSKQPTSHGFSQPTDTKLLEMSGAAKCSSNPNWNDRIELIRTNFPLVPMDFSR